VHVPKAAELVAGTLRRQIVRGELSEGDALPSETSLMDFYGVSRPTLREALRVLEAERLIKVHRGSHGGARVQSPNGDVAARYAALVLEHQGASMADVYEARTIIEPPCARILAQRRTKGDLALLWASIAEAEAANETDNEDDVRAVRVQNDFHALIVGLAQNQTTAVLWGMLRHIIDSMIVSRVEREATHLGARSHRRLVELIESQDDEGAERLWRKHLTESSKFLTGGPGANTLLQLLD
jgi:DNA-binding FadR family transcriptional regulator